MLQIWTIISTLLLTFWIGCGRSEETSLCDQLATAVENFYYDSAVMLFNARNEVARSRFRQRVIKEMGFDPENKDSIRDFACSVVDANSVEELAEQIGVSEMNIMDMITYWRNIISRMDGFESMWRTRDIMVRLVNKAADSGLPYRPLNITEENARAFLQEMVDDYGETFIQDVLKFQTSLPEVTWVVDDVEAFASALVTSDTAAAFAEQLEVPAEEVTGLLGVVNAFIPRREYVGGAIGSLIELLEVATEAGLFDLEWQG